MSLSSVDAGSAGGTSGKVLLVLNVPPPYGGGEILASILADKLSEDEQFLIYAYSRAKSSKASQGKISLGNICFGLKLIRAVREIIRKDQPHKIYMSLPKSFTAFIRMAPIISYAVKRGVKVYGELAGARFSFVEDGGWKKEVGLHFLRRVYSFHFLGKHIADHYQEYGFTNCSNFPNGVELPAQGIPRNFTSLQGAMLNLLYVGALNESKGVGRIIEAVALCLEKGINVRCTLIGEWSDTRYGEIINNRISELRIADSLHFTGLLKGEEKWQFYQEAEILVHPTSWDGQPLTILEAMGMGCAVISTQVGAIPDTVCDGRNGLLMERISAEDLYRCIARLASDRELLCRMSEWNVQDFSDSFTTHRYTEHFTRWITNETT